ncbi:hypothetical protein [Noviherbaspirillum sp. ST9]|uniref:hypothetical protein n=1 Tax=Noviherbaspirillum sp. ST9 TaxID=3401606 RepID=UPI003B588675
MNAFGLRAGIAAPLLMALTCLPLGAQERDPFDTLPDRDPQALQQLLDLDDTQLSRLLQESDGARFRSVVSAFDPPGAAIFPLSHGFAGARQACLAARTATACRLYVTDLLAVQRERQSAAAVSSNPFTPR